MQIDFSKFHSKGEVLQKLVESFLEACKNGGGTPDVIIDSYQDVNLSCVGLKSDEDIEKVYNTLSALKSPQLLGLAYPERVYVKIEGDNKEINACVGYKRPLEVRISEKKPLPTKFASGIRTAFEFDGGNAELYISCKDECYVTYKQKGVLQDYLQVKERMDKKLERVLAPAIEFDGLFTKECKDVGGELDGFVCKVNSLEAADKLYGILRRFGKSVPFSWFSYVNAGIKYRGENDEYFVRCSAGDTCEVFSKHEESVELPDDVLESDALEPFLNYAKFRYCDVDDDSITCKYDWRIGSSLDEDLKPGNLLNWLDGLSKELIDVLVRSAEDIKKGNVWKQLEQRDVCGIPFPVYEKDDEELALGYGNGASGGYAFWDVEEIPDTMMQELYKEYFAGESYLLDEMEEECKEEEKNNF